MVTCEVTTKKDLILQRMEVFFVLKNIDFYNYDKQLLLLKEKGLLITNDDAAKKILKNFSYYTIINGYKDLFTNKHTYITGTRIETLYELHWIDLKLSGILFKYSLVIEKKLKSSVSYLVSNSFGITESEYLKKERYALQKYNMGKYYQLNRKFDDIKRNDISAKYYNSEYTSIPPWVIVKGMSFGAIKIWYSILRSPHKQLIIQDFNIPNLSMKLDEQLDFFDRILTQVYDYRNCIAHGNRTFSLEVTKNLKRKHLIDIGILKYFDKDTQYSYTDLYSVLISMFMLIDDEYILQDFLRELTAFFANYEVGYSFAGKNIYQVFNLPSDILDRLALYFRDNKLPTE